LERFGETRPVQVRSVPAESPRGEVSAALSSEYQERYGLDIPNARAGDARVPRRALQRAIHFALHAHAQIHHHRAVTALMRRQLVERVENEETAASSPCA